VRVCVWCVCLFISLLTDTHDVFSCYDTRGDDRIAVTQIGDVLRALGQAPTQADIAKCSEQWPMHGLFLFCFVFLFCSLFKHTR
jgi:hypothetical protein